MTAERRERTNWSALCAGQVSAPSEILVDGIDCLGPRAIYVRHERLRIVVLVD